MTLRTLRTASLWWLLGLSLVDGCATTDSTSNATTAQTPTPRRRRRRRRPEAAADSTAMPTMQPVASAADDAGAAGPSASAGVFASPVIGGMPAVATTGSGATASSGSGSAASATFGAPVVAASDSSVQPRWVDDDYGGHIECVGALPRPASVSAQCPLEPIGAMIVRAFLPVEQQVLRCGPPANEHGRLPMRAIFNGSGALRELRFPGLRVDRERGLCMARALCTARMPTFRASESSVTYEFVIYIPDSDG